jgi:flagellar hook-length control protein FliK
MTSSLPSLPLVSGKPDLLPGGAKEIHINHHDAGSSDGFGGLLGEAYAALSTPAGEQPAAPARAGQLLGELQTLPQDGKLLPLLRRTLDNLAESGLDPQKFIERLNANLEALTQNSELQPAEQLAVALQQLIHEQPTLKSVLPGELLSMVADKKSAQRPLNADNTGAAANGLAEQARKFAGSGLEPDQELQSTSIKPIKSAPADLPAQQSLASQFQQALAKEVKPATRDNDALSQFQQQPAALEQRQPELAVLMAALKRMTIGNRPVASVDSTSRADLAVAGAASPASVTTAQAPSATSGTPTVSINTPFGQAGWDQALGERIQWLAGQKMQGAHVKLNPANLGPMEVRIQVHNDQASVQFTAQHAVVREALEAALPRLRDMFDASGVQLVDVDVSSGESFTEQQAMQDSTKPHWKNGIAGDEDALDIPNETPLTDFVARGYLDLFA